MVECVLLLQELSDMVDILVFYEISAQSSDHPFVLRHFFVLVQIIFVLTEFVPGLVIVLQLVCWPHQHSVSQ